MTSKRDVAFAYYDSPEMYEDDRLMMKQSVSWESFLPRFWMVSGGTPPPDRPGDIMDRPGGTSQVQDWIFIVF